MTVVEIENNLHNLVANFDKENFIFELLLAYGIPKSTIKRLQGSDHDKLTSYGELVMRKKLFFSDTMWYSWERTQNFAWEGIS